VVRVHPVQCAVEKWLSCGPHKAEIVGSNPTRAIKEENMAIPKDILAANPGLGDWSILTGYRGSIAHNMYVPNSSPTSIDDKDVMAICVPPIEYYYGLREYGSRGTKEIFKNEWDIVIYEFKKFISLLKRGNPNVLSMLWLQKNHYLHLSEEGQFLIDNRELFVGKHVFHSFSGYAHAQFYKMTHMAFKGYMGEKRKQLVEQFGYDTKNAAHLIRLLKMCIEFLCDGELHVFRDDSEELLSIKRGEWTLEKVKEKAEDLFKKSEEAFIRSTLKVKPDDDAINKLCVDILRMRFA
jgi:uncharacterized protein